jgi:3-oxoacyl-[acyl-carrier-protein] synthase-1
MTAHQHPSDCVVVGMGLCTPLGLTTRATQVAVHAGATRFAETETLDLDGEPAIASVLKMLGPDLTRTERMATLAATALVECLGGRSRAVPERLPTFLGLPENKGGAPVRPDALVQALTEAAVPHGGLQFLPESLYAGGRAAFFQALAGAAAYLHSGRADTVLVGAVDSFCDEASLEYLLDQNRLLGPDSSDGLIPGEGAGFVLLGRSGPNRLGGSDPPVRVLGCALAREPHHFLQSEPNLAEGLTKVFRQLRKHPATGTRRVDYLLSCQTGETFWAQEFVKAYLRNEPLFPEPLAAALIAETLGDVGASSGVLQLGVALYTIRNPRRQPERPMRVLIYGCSDDGQIGACIVEG